MKSTHLKVLVEHLRGDVDAGEPAAVAGVRVVPTDGVLHPPHLDSMQHSGIPAHPTNGLIHITFLAASMYSVMYS